MTGTFWNLSLGHPELLSSTPTAVACDRVREKFSKGSASPPVAPLSLPVGSRWAQQGPKQQDILWYFGSGLYLPELHQRVKLHLHEFIEGGGGATEREGRPSLHFLGAMGWEQGVGGAGGCHRVTMRQVERKTSRSSERGVWVRVAAVPGGARAAAKGLIVPMMLRPLGWQRGTEGAFIAQAC